MLQTSMRVTLQEFDNEVAPELDIGPYCARSFMDDIAQGAETRCDRDMLADGVHRVVVRNGFSEQESKRLQNRVNGTDSSRDKAGTLFGVQLLMRAAVRAGKTMDDPLAPDLVRRAYLLQDAYARTGDTLVVACDASLVGWACTVTDIDGTRLYARRGLHDVGHESWSIPRLELYALAEARKTIDSVLSEDPKVEKIILLSDSSINVQRLTSKGNISSKLVPWDVRTIAVLRSWLKDVPVVLGHVKGTGNPSDCASRPLYPNSYDEEAYQ
ncbi:hypothetical protein Pmar_PMAR021276 [Perkinsus marinus ATCC 50983]|uniref:Uncharacterized protein n=1 Tax=Perkinsus marinus (strain ATCC 50983 / TXsc) TaxID=423536 RepID=C5LAZ2_PERM5|nr:hypothetical protein Pmar_PMAR021276 [Perkinsus marinus ATCC 50983]EER06086.1 hypothetical protein Pmar_PMAR021276 [Perkinsus marinus ATCC 50983]|eukprot:XP_002774270.1 hypothetical protein Pmar_PMAR021276 [Perkinsus marinus ATCC 50983]